MDPQQQINIFQRIVFQQCNQNQQLRRLSLDQKIRLKQAVSQKIAYESIYKESYPQQVRIQDPHQYYPPNPIATICCCLYPQDNKQHFEITSSLFAKRLCHTLMIWRDDFLQIKEDESQAQPKPDLYGPLWLSITYIIILGIAANYNIYFKDSTNWAFDNNQLVTAVGMLITFALLEVLIYPAVIGCLGGHVTNNQSANLFGYSLILYFIPTLCCVIPSQMFHLIMLLLGEGIRFIFMGRNFSSRLDSKKIIIYIVIIAIEALHFYLVNSTFFTVYAGASIQQGLDKVFHQRTFEK